MLSGARPCKVVSHLAKMNRGQHSVVRSGLHALPTLRDTANQTNRS